MFVDNGPRKEPRKFFRWSLVLAANAAFLLIVGVSTARETYQEWKVEQEIKAMQSQVESLEGKKLQLTDLVQKLNAPDALDKEARARLGLQKPGEKVIVLKGLDAAVLPRDAGAPQAMDPEASVSNPGKWFHYFFSL